jgi:hypothetical protein
MLYSMSDNERQPGQAGEGITKEELKYERLRALMSIDEREAIDSKAIAEAWGTNYQTVGSLLSIAKSKPSFNTQLKKDHGYTDSDFPVWWHSEATALESETLEANSLKEPSTLATEHAEHAKTPGYTPPGEQDIQADPSLAGSTVKAPYSAV